MLNNQINWLMETLKHLVDNEIPNRIEQTVNYQNADDNAKNKLHDATLEIHCEK